MSKKLIYLVSFVLVLGLALTSAVEAADPSLVGWWKFDENSGNIAKDSSGNGNDGTFQGNPLWVAGMLGAALEFDGDDWVDCGDVLTITEAITIACWVNPAGLIDDNGWVTREGAYAFKSNGTSIRFTTPGVLDYTAGNTVLEIGTWQHVAVTFVPNQTGGAIFYLNGVEAQRMDSTAMNPGAGPFRIGNNQWGQFYEGMIDDVRVYDRVLTLEEIQEAMIGIPPGSASNPSPAHEATDVPRDVTLSWTPGEFAAPTNGHKVYFGQSFNDVNDATGGVAQDANSYTPAQRLDFSTTYYWRIDEVNAPPTSQIEFKSEVWSFTTEPIAYAIENITATASSTHQADTGPENTINGLGLDANDLHSIEPADMWLSGDEPNGTWIEYELDKVHKLHEMWVWNHNGMLESVLGFGFKDVTIEYSTNGTDYTTLGTTHEFARAPGAVDYAHNTTIDFGGVTAKYVRLTTNSNWGAGLLDQYGLSEVR
ncbi:MAG: discoidin domain-containing protein, partial [Planctomycetes bacterium]|nr:discoidin domain-containing protein [Planctomycetota bacterium]